MNYWQTLVQYHAFPGPLYLAGSSVLWLATGILILTGIAGRSAWTCQVTRWTAIIFTAWWWIDRLFIQVGHTTSLIPALFTGFMLLFIFVGFGRADVKLYFRVREKHGRTK